MIPEETLLNIAKGLYDKTMKGDVNWKREPPRALPISPRPKATQDAYMVVLPQSIITLSYTRPPTEVDNIQLRLRRSDDQEPVGFWQVEEGDEHWQLVADLYALVHKQVTGWDKVLEDVYRFLGTQASSHQS